VVPEIVKQAWGVVKMHEISSSLLACSLSAKSFLLASSFQSSLNPCRITTHRQHSDNIGNFIHDFVINGIRKSPGKHSVKTIFSVMNAGMDYQ
jgi:hypothetical protein